MKGLYMIGVQSPQKVNFTIAVSNSEVSFGILHKGIPMNYKKNKGEQSPTFNYYHESTESFTILLKEDYGFAHLLANSLMPSEA